MFVGAGGMKYRGGLQRIRGLMRVQTNADGISLGVTLE